MKFRLFALFLITALTATAQMPFKPKALPRPADEWNDKEVLEKNRMAPRANVIPYRNDDDIEKLAYAESPYLFDLNGDWQVQYAKDYADPTDMLAAKTFNTDDWESVSVPVSHWKMSGKEFRGQVPDNAVSLPAKGNATALYCKTFDVPKVWGDYHAYLRFHATSAAYVWVNGKFVGYGEDSRTLQEFDITSFLQPGVKNTIAIQVLSLSTSSLMECYMDRGYLGLTGDVDIMLKPHIHVRDYRITPDYNPQSKEFSLKLSANIYNMNKKGQVYVETEVWDPKGKEVEKMGKWVVFDKRDELRFTLDRSFFGLKTWSAEDPNLYTLVIRLRDKEMNLLETVGTRFAFRHVEVDQGLLKVNGHPVTLHGAVYADYALADKGLNSRSRILKDLQLMKQNNFNAVRTAYYSPASEYFYEVCDALGLYVLCDANLQPFVSNNKVIATDNDYSAMFEDRINHMVGTLKNHPSIILWSLGSSVDNGICMEAAYKTLRQRDKSRPILYSGAQYSENTDIIAPCGLTVDELKQFLAKEQSRPLVLFEFGSTQGNNFGGMSEMWKLIAEKDQLQGGFVSYWNPFRYIPRAYSDNNTSKNEGVVTEGIMDANQKPAPYLAEIRNLYRPFDVEILNLSPNGGEFNITNMSGFLTLNDFVMEYNIFSNLKPRIIEGEVRMDLKPAESKTFRLKIPYMQLYAGEELFIRFTVKQRNAIPGVAKGMELGVIEFPLPMRKVAQQELPNYDRQPLSITRRTLQGDADAAGQVVEISNGTSTFQYNLESADLESLRFADRELLQQAPRLNFWRAATDNDRVDKNGVKAWSQLNPDKMRREVVATNFRKIDDYTVGIDAMLRYSNPEDATMMDVKQSIIILHTGDVLIDNELVLSEKVKIMPKVGLQFGASKSLKTAEWFGMDKETYSDRCSSGTMGVYSLPVTDLFYKYSHPQESGNRSQVRWVALRDSICGLFMDMVDTQFNFSIYPYADKQMTNVDRFAELKETNHWVVNTDFRVAGVGATLGGVPIGDDHLINDRKFHFRLHLRAYDPEEYDPQDFRRIAYPQVESTVLPMPAIAANKDRFDSPMQVTLTCETPKAMIHYTTDGSTPTEKSPHYTKPFTIQGSTLIKARTFKPNCTPSFTTTKRYVFDYIVSAKFDNKPNTPYNYNVDKILFDGETGDVEDLSRGWLGFSGNDLSVTFTLAKAIELERAELRFAHVPDAWVFAPVEVYIEVSSDGENFSKPIPAIITYNPGSKEMNSAQLVSMHIDVDQKNVKYVRLVAKNMQRIPQWHKAKGLKSWLMIDEIQLNEIIR